MNLQFFLDHFGVAVSAASGVLAARGKKVDLFGVLVLSVVTAFGGGTTRDLLLGDTPVFWIRETHYLLNATVTALVVFVLARRVDFPRRSFMLADAFALAFFTLIGLRKALHFGLAPESAVALGVITGVAGGIIRDVLIDEIPLVFRRETHYYATASLAGAGVYVLLAHFGVAEPVSTWLAIGVILGLRVVAIRWKLSLPEFTA